jgi:ABC-type lipoprotein export system ATPase subunit
VIGRIPEKNKLVNLVEKLGQLNEPQTILLIGSVGSGKSTLLGDLSHVCTFYFYLFLLTYERIHILHQKKLDYFKENVLLLWFVF